MYAVTTQARVWARVCDFLDHRTQQVVEVAVEDAEAGWEDAMPVTVSFHDEDAWIQARSLAHEIEVGMGIPG